MDKIDITMTSVLRPEIVRGTLKSFFKSMFYKNPDRYRLIVNIDPLGNGKATANDVLEVCKNHFKKVVYNISKEPSFPKAVRWTWDQVESPWVFHLEDDWIVHRKVDVDHMIEIMNKYKDLACLRLYKEPIPNVLTPRIFNTKYRYNEEGFFVADDQKKQFGLNPVLIRGEFVKTGRTMMVDDKNPEKLVLGEFLLKLRRRF